MTLAAMLIGLPLVGVALDGKPLAPYLAFPPATERVPHVPFSWWAFCALSALIVAVLLPVLLRVWRSPAPSSSAEAGVAAFPCWGWLGLVLLVLSWWLAWNRFGWLGALQAYTFTPLWLGYIVVINAHTYRRRGGCMLCERPRYFLALFLVSAAFWWFFEYLNRFVHSWYYIGVGQPSPWEYFWQATLPFSTVLPAVLGTREWLATFPRLGSGLADVWHVRLPAPRLTGYLALVLAGAGLAGIGVWPDEMFALLWVAPLVIITALQAVLGERTIFAPLGHGDWRTLWQAALAALLCGFLWELWNSKSLAHWEYAIPWVHRYEIFYMPVLGYAGYLPFGLECLAVASLLDRVWAYASR
jgi:hypothetical protein